MKRIVIIVCIVLMISGVVVGAYPFICRRISAQETAVTVRQLVADSSDFTADEQQEQLEKARRYNEQINGHTVSAGDRSYIRYTDTLNMLDGIIGYISIPKIGLQLPIYHGTDDETLLKGAGHYEYSSFPIGDNGTHSIITGHNGLPQSELFSRITELKVGDRFDITVLNHKVSYTVDKVYTILPSEISTIKAETGKCYISLVTCIPYRINSHRLIVRAVRTDSIDDTETQTNMQTDYMVTDNTETKDKLLVIGIIAIFIVLAVIIVIFNRRRTT